MVFPTFDVKSREDAKKIIGIGNRPIILCAGLMKPSDQLPTILDAVSSLVTKIPDLLFVHLGQSSYEEAKLSGSSYRHQLLLMARQYGLVNNVCFIDRFLPNDEWCTYLQCADLCIVAEADESTSQCAKLPMAMAAGLAIMSSPFLYANEILGDKLGEISAFDDARVLSTKMQNLLGNPKQLALYRQAAGDFGAQFSWSVMAPKYLGLSKKRIVPAQQAVVICFDERCPIACANPVGCPLRWGGQCRCRNALVASDWQCNPAPMWWGARQ
jgi:polysaccharide biosynthesis protein PslF